MSPWRLLTLVLAVAGTVGVIVLATRSTPRDHAADRARAARESAALERRSRTDPVVLRERARRSAEQRVHTGRVARSPRSHAGQAALVAALSDSITRDARGRVRRHELDHPVQGTVCERIVQPPVPRPPPPPLSTVSAGYDCTAITVRVAGAAGKVPSEIIGFPFLARVNFRTGRYVWCKVSRRPAEHGTGVELAFVPLPKACDVLPGRA